MSIVQSWMLALTFAAAEPAPTYHFPDHSERLTPDENAALDAILTTVARAHGKQMVDADAAAKAVAAVRKGVSPNGETCGAPVAYKTRTHEVAQRLGLCAGGTCSLRAAHWSVGCSQEWEACSVGLTFSDEDQETQDERVALLIPEKEARAWRSVGDFLKALGRMPAKRWRSVEDRPDGVLAGLFGSGGLGMSSDTAPLREKVAEPGTVERYEQGTITTPDVVWNLFRDRRSDDRAVEAEGDAAVTACLEHVAPGEQVSVWLRRGPKGVPQLISDAEEPAAGCLLKALAARAAERKDVHALRWELSRKAGDVVTSNGKYVVDVRAERAMRGPVPWSQDAKVSDPALEGWKTAPAPTFARCLVQYPFTDAYAAREKRTALKVGYTVTFDALGKATDAELSIPKGVALATEVQSCLKTAVLQSGAPCSARGGTAEGSITAAAFVAGRAP